MRHPGPFLLFFFSLPHLALAQGAGDELEFAGRSWRVFGEDVKVESYLGQEAVRFRNGAIALRDLEFENATIEFDVATTGHRSFIGSAFRVDLATSGYEDFYLRPHNSGRFDAMQYTPVNNGVSAWQLYPQYNRMLEIPRERWLHVRMVISGSRLAVHFDGADTPTLVVENLRRGRTRGTVVLKSNFPAAQELPRVYPTAFANFRLTAEEIPGTYPAEATPMAGTIRAWSISPAFPAPVTPIRDLSEDWLTAEGWRTAQAEGSGLVNLAEYVGIPDGSRRGTVVARVVIESERDQVKRLGFGFSDAGSIFLNRRLLFSGNNTYRSRSQRYLGVVTVDNDALYLPLRRGSNELLVAVTEAFGGWGLIARLEDLEGIRVQAQSP